MPAVPADPRAIHRRLLSLAPRARMLLGGAVAAGLAGAALLVVQALALAHVVAGAAFDGKDVAALRDSLIVLGAAIAGRALLSAATEWLGRRAAEQSMAELRHRVAARVLSAQTRRVDEARRGELATAAVHGVDALADYYAKAVPQLALAGAVPPVFVGVVLLHDPLVGILLGLTLPLVVVFMVLVGRESAERIGERRQALGVLGAHFLDVVRGLPTLRAHGRAEAQAGTLGEIGERYRAESVAALRVAFLSALVLELLAMVGTAIAAAVVGVQLAGGALGFEAGLVVLLLAPEVYNPLRLAGQRYHAAEDGAHAAQTLLDVIDAPPARAEAVRAEDDAHASPTLSDGIHASPARAGAARAPESSGDFAPTAGGNSPVLDPVRGSTADRPSAVGTDSSLLDPAAVEMRVAGVRVAGGAGRAPALDGLDATFAPGTLTALVGASGAGKSTLLRLLARLADPDEGRVSCGAVDLRTVEAEAWWRHVAWLPQRPALLRGPLRETLTLQHPDATPDEIVTALHRAAATEVIEELARDGLAMSVGVGGSMRAAPVGACADASFVACTATVGVGDSALSRALATPVGTDRSALSRALATLVGAGGRGLSGGQAQRLVLAGALLSRAPLLLLDEPTAHLDPASAAAAAAGIRAAAAGRTAIVATHDPALMAVCDATIELSGGRVVAADAVGAAA